MKIMGVFVFNKEIQIKKRGRFGDRMKVKEKVREKE